MRVNAIAFLGTCLLACLLAEGTPATKHTQSSNSNLSKAVLTSPLGGHLVPAEVALEAGAARLCILLQHLQRGTGKNRWREL